MSKKQNGRKAGRTKNAAGAKRGGGTATPKVARQGARTTNAGDGAADPAAVPTVAAASVEVKITAAKGRPMLTWVGKRPLRHVKAFPAQQIESFAATGAAAPAPSRDWPAAYPQGGLLFHGDNKEVLGHLLASGFRGKVNLIYIDPPFDSGADYVRKVSLRGATGTARLDGEGYTLGEQIQYTDIWANDNYLQFMYERLLLLRELLAGNGSIYVHIDARKVHHLRFLLDEVFGADAFRNQISWKRTTAHAGAHQFGAVTDYLLFYSLDPQQSRWNQQYQEMTETHRTRHYRHRDDQGTYALGELTAPGLRRGPSGEAWRGFNPSALGRHWARVPTELDRLDREAKIYWPTREGAWPRLKRYEAETQGRACTDFWDDVDPINMVGSEREDYPTQKPEALIERVVLASSNAGDLVFDCFIGSGTTAAVAQKLGRRWIGCDINKGAIQTTAKRLQGVIEEQASAQGGLGLDGDRPAPAQLSFSTWRVNDYDLQVQHNEAVNLAADFLGLQRSRTDGYFDGTLGSSLVKIIPFGRPLTPLDLEELRRELDARPDEDRPVTMVCLGMELGARAWVDEWNALRRGVGAVNKIRVIELRTDSKYGGFLKHDPAKARVRVGRRGGRIEVEVVDFVSPSIVQRLEQQAGVLAPRIDDWRAMVDCVMIDPAFDGQVFKVALTDVPERKADLVEGRYELPAPEGKTTVAVKIIDMLGEEVLETREV